MDKIRFVKVCDEIIRSERQKNGIGTLGEKTLHAVLKQYFEPDKTKHEIKKGSFVADIVCDGGIIEIQTRAFDKLRKKLSEFLKLSAVTVVFAVPKTKWLVWIDEKTGETTKKRKSPGRGKIYDIIPELYKIKNLLPYPDLKFCIVFLEIIEYRYLNGWSEDKKKGSSRCDRVPVDIVDEVNIENVADYNKFIPKELARQFTSKDYKTAAKINLRTAQTALNILNYLGIVSRIGKQGNNFIYEYINHSE